MSGKCFVDTDILIYAHDRSAGSKHLRAQMLLEQLWGSGWGVLSTQVLEELCIHLCREAANPLPMEELRLLLRDYSAWEVVVNTPRSVPDALEIMMRYQVHFWDALILEAAERAGVSVLFSEALATGKRYGAIQVVNPLISSVVL
jgi:predicted nucleic acid-binding protein